MKGCGVKVLVHAINGVGFGHMTRTALIVESLRQACKDLRAVFVTNSRFPEFLSRYGCKVYPLKHYPGAGPMSYDAYLSANDQVIRRIIAREQPDCLLMDSEFNKSLVQYCFDTGLKTCFVLRNTTDAKVVHLFRERWLEKVDLLLVPHELRSVNALQRKIFLQHHRVCFTGPIFRNASPIRRRRSGAVRLLITFSTGAQIPENRFFYRMVETFLARLKSAHGEIKGRKIDPLIVTGPFFDTTVCDLHGYKKKKFHPDLPLLMSGSDLIVSAAGYNTVNEIVQTRTPALLVPLPRMADDQFARARELAATGGARVVKRSLWAEVNSLLRPGILDSMRQKHSLMVSGNAQAAAAVADLVCSRP